MPWFSFQVCTGTQITAASYCWAGRDKTCVHEYIWKFILHNIEDEQSTHSYTRIILLDDATVNQHPCFAHVDSSIKLLTCVPCVSRYIKGGKASIKHGDNCGWCSQLKSSQILIQKFA